MSADDEVHHRQSDLERAAVDHPERISAGAAAGSDGAGAHGAQARAEPPTAPCTSRSRQASATRSAASASTSPTSSWSISTTRRTRTCSPTTSAPTATAACGCRIPRSTRKLLLTPVEPERALHRGPHQEDVRQFGGRHQAPRLRSRCTSPTRPRSSTRLASWRSATTSMAAMRA